MTRYQGGIQTTGKSEERKRCQFVKQKSSAAAFLKVINANRKWGTSGSTDAAPIIKEILAVYLGQTKA